MRIVLAALAVSLVLAAAGCGRPAADRHDVENASANDPGPAIEVREARAMISPGMAAVYLTVDDRGDAGDRLVSVATPAAASATLHETVAEGDVMRMVERPEGFAVDAGGRLVLEPGGRHVMLMEPEVAPGQETIPLELRFERAGTVEIEVPVTVPGGHDEHHEHDMPGHDMSSHDMPSHDPSHGGDGEG